MRPDGDFVVATIGVVLTIVVITAAVAITILVNTQQQITFERVCVASQRAVVYESVHDSLVSECK